MKKIKVTVAPDGTTRIATEGFTGTACKDATRGLEKALGKVTSEKLTEEFYAVKEQEHTHVSNGQ